MANPFPFTAGQVLTAAQMNGIGEGGSIFTPTLTNGVLGNGTLNCTFQRLNKIVIATYIFALGSTSTITGSLQFSLPVTGTTLSNMPIQTYGTGLFSDASVGIDYPIAAYQTSTSSVGLYVYNASGTYTNIGLVNATVPVAYAVNDTIRFRAIYEAA
jgi:hypothetical protein